MALADGVGKIPEYPATLKRPGYAGLYTLHSEYLDGNSWKQLSVEECLEQTRRDLQYAKKLMFG